VESPLAGNIGTTPGRSILMRIVTPLLLAAGIALAASSAHAQAGPALVINDLNLRAAPSANSPSLGVIPGGSTIEAGPCGGGWCGAFVNGRSGYVSQQYLDFGGGGGPGPGAYVPVPPPGYGPPPAVYAPPPPPPVVYGPPPYYGPYGPPPPYWGWRRW
jgi:uncharacterized protein YraI